MVPVKGNQNRPFKTQDKGKGKGASQTDGHNPQ